MNDRMDDIFVARPSMPPYEEYIAAIKPLWDSHLLTNMGTYHQELETRLKEYLGVEGVSLMVNGHMALELILQAMNFPKDGEVITTPFTFISTTHAIVRNGLTPVFCDVKPEDGTMDETGIEKLITSKTVAILPVHVYGNVCNVEEIQKIADKHGLKVIYDAAHAFGTVYQGKGIGSYGDASIFSFHATKMFNTVEGGAVVFHSPELYGRLYNLKNFGIRGEELVCETGSNAKMNELCAIMGICNLNHIKEAIADRRLLYEEYKRQLQDIRGIRMLVQTETKAVERNYGYLPILVEADYPLTRDMLYQLLAKNGIHARKYFYPLTPDHECYKTRFSNTDISCARMLASEILALPIYEGLRIENVRKITSALKGERDDGTK